VDRRPVRRVRVNFVGEQDHLSCWPGHAAGVWLCGVRLVACQNLLR
jgi:hypothetical protein